MKNIIIIFVILIGAIVYLDIFANPSEPIEKPIAPIAFDKSKDPNDLLARAFDPENDPTAAVNIDTLSDLDKITYAHDNGLSNIQVRGKGVVVRILADDNEGSRHQKFILKLQNNLTVLIAHNIDIADRVNSLSKGDTIEFYGEYEWNNKGGVVHWTHRDPNGVHISGYLKYVGLKYQ